MVNQKNTIEDGRLKRMAMLFINNKTLQHTYCTHALTRTHTYQRFIRAITFTVYVCNSALQWENQENRIIKLFHPGTRSKLKRFISSGRVQFVCECADSCTTEFSRTFYCFELFVLYVSH